jgi:hypothetical protein
VTFLGNRPPDTRLDGPEPLDDRIVRVLGRGEMPTTALRAILGTRPRRRGRKDVLSVVLDSMHFKQKLLRYERDPSTGEHVWRLSHKGLARHDALTGRAKPGHART